MKKILLLLACFLSASVMYAQISSEEAEAVANLLGVQKKEAIAKLVQVNGKDSIAFWKLYDEYQKKNVQTAKSRIYLYERTATIYGAMNAKTADSLARKYFENRMSQEKALEEYYKKIKAATNAVTAFEFYQAELYILTQVRANIMHQIPTYSEFKMYTAGKK
jgi:hypothetical protein